MRGLDQHRIVEAALELLDQDGLAGVTTRRLAEKLGVRQPSLYWHVKDREELLGLLSDRVVADARWPKPQAVWRDMAESLMREYLRCLLAHRDAARVVAGRPPMGPNRLRGAEMLLQALLSAGLAEAEAIDAGSVLTTYVVGFALEQQAAGGSTPDIDVEPDRHPTLTRLARSVPPAGRSPFDEGLRYILDGVERRLQDRAPGASRRR